MDVYERLREILDTYPTGAPKSASFDEILKILFTPEEAAVAIHMSFAPKSVEFIAKAAGLPEKETEKHLENMANKVIVLSRVKDGKRLYGLVPTIPGLFEFPFMKGGGTPELDRLAKLWEQYHDEAMGASFAGKPTPIVRVIPIGRALDSRNHAHPYEEVARIIDDAEFIALAQCACRVSVGACDAPKEVCLIFGNPGRFLVERGYAREIGKGEAHKVLDIAEDAGLIHTSTNSADKASLICNCCPCCCTILRGRTKLNLKEAFATSGFEAQVNAEECDGCAICADERCPMGAINVRDGKAVVKPDSCVGCGLCVTGCPSGAIRLERRANPPKVYSTVQELGLKIVKEKGTLEKFIEVMKR